MAECKDIDKALAKLGNKIDAQNKCCSEVKAELGRLNNRIGKLERDFNQALKPGQNKNPDLTAIYKRLAQIENYINILDSTGKTMQQGFKQIKELFLGN